MERLYRRAFTDNILSCDHIDSEVAFRKLVGAYAQVQLLLWNPTEWAVGRLKDSHTIAVSFCIDFDPAVMRLT